MTTSEAVAEIGHNQPPSTTDLLRQRFADEIKEVDELAAKATAAKEKLGEHVEVTDDDQVSDLVEIAVKAGKKSKALDKKRLETTQPLRDEVDEVNKFFATLTARMNRVKTVFEELVGQWDRKKRAEEQRKAAEAARLAEEEARRKLDDAAAASHSVEGDVIMNEAAAAERKAQIATHQATKAGAGPTRTEGGTVSATKSWDFHVENWDALDLSQLRDSFTVADIEKAIRAHVRKHKNTRPLKGVKIFEDTKTRLRG